MKFLCPVPGYDRHFKVTESFGHRDDLHPHDRRGARTWTRWRAAIRDPAVKGMWNVPKYSNPDGIIYSAETIRRIASMKPAAPDFLLMWDNAYCIHEFEGGLCGVPRTSSASAPSTATRTWCSSSPSTSKVTLPGGGISCFACSEANMALYGEAAHRPDHQL